MARTYQQKKESGAKLRGPGKRTKQPWQFIGIDGEGSTDPATGKSIYQILSAFDGEKEHCIEDANGLTTLRCLRFILDLRNRQKRLAICGYGFSYDISNILVDAPWRKIKELAKDEAMWLYSTETQRYKVRVIHKKLLEIWELEKREGDWKTSRYVRVYDVIGFFQKSFLGAIREWKVGDKAELEFIEKYKDKRGENLIPDWDMWKQYNMTECHLLRDLMLRFNEMLEAEDIHLTNWWGAGSIASYWYKKNDIRAHLVQQQEPEIQRDIMYAYFGGQVQTFYRGRFKGPIYHYDINSAYPWATSLLPSLNGVWQKTDRFDPKAKWAIYHIEYDFTSVWEKTRYGPLPWRLKHQQIVYPRKGRGIFWSPEVAAVLDLWPDCVKVVRGWLYKPDTETLPFSWVPALFERRNALKQAGDARNIPLKLGLNSLYGKTAQGEGMKDAKGKKQFPPYQSYMWAGLITSMTRAKMIRAIGSNPGAVLNVATDGIYSREPLALEIGKELGNWSEEERLEWFELYGNGVYRGMYYNRNGDEEYIRRARGCEERSLDFDSLGAEFRARGTSAVVWVTRNRFRGYKIAAHRNRPEQFATWGEERSRFSVLTFGPFGVVGEIQKEREYEILQIECIARRNVGSVKEDRSFPEPYISRGSPLVVADNFNEHNIDRILLDEEQP